MAFYPKRAQQSVQQTAGSLRDLGAFFPGQSARTGWLRVFPAPKQNPRPPTRGYPVKNTRDESASLWAAVSIGA